MKELRRHAHEFRAQLQNHEIVYRMDSFCINLNIGSDALLLSMSDINIYRHIQTLITHSVPLYQ